MNIEKLISHTFKVGCIILTACVFFHLYDQYDANEDASRISLKELSHADLFPAISLCFQSSSHYGLYDNNTLMENLGIPASQFKSAMQGNSEQTNFSDVLDYNFEMATIKLQKYLKEMKVKDTSGNSVDWEFHEKMDFRKIKPKIKIEKAHDIGNITANRSIMLKYQDPNVICYEYDSDLYNQLKIDYVSFYFSIARLKTIEGGYMKIYVHQPKQLIRNLRYTLKVNRFSHISQHIMTNRIVMDIHSIRKMKNRPDANEPCDETLENDDATWMKHVIEIVGCVPPYWNIFFVGKDGTKYHQCNTTDQLNLLNQFLPEGNELGRNKIFKMYRPPCVQMHVLSNTNLDEYSKEELLKIVFRFR